MHGPTTSRHDDRKERFSIDPGAAPRLQKMALRRNTLAACPRKL